MRAQAAAAFYPEMLLLEASQGVITWCYPDSRLLPTTGIGSLLGSTARLDADGLALPWRFPTGEYATEAQIANEWEHLRSLGVIGDGYAYKPHASLFLDAPVVQWDFERRAAAKEAALTAYLPWPQLPADAQLAALSIAWNTGEHVYDPLSVAYWASLTVPLRAGNYLAAAEHCMVNGKPSERNRRNRLMFTQSARAVFFGEDGERLYGPTVTLSAARLDAAQRGGKSSTAWWVQRLLQLTGASLALDGLWGPVSQGAMAKYGKARQIAGTTTLPILRALAAETLQVTVSA